MERILPLVVVAVVAAVGGCAREAAPDGGNQGVRGVVLLGPSCPVATQASPCPDEPLPGVDIRVIRDGTVLRASATTDAFGRFELPLPPGPYTLEADAGEMGPGMSAKPIDVTVRPGRFVDVTLLVDTGIR